MEEDEDSIKALLCAIIVNIKIMNLKHAIMLINGVRYRRLSDDEEWG